MTTAYWKASRCMSTSTQAKLRSTSFSRTRIASWCMRANWVRGRDNGKCQRGRGNPKSHARIRLDVKNYTRSANDCGLPGLYITMPPTRVSGDMDGLMGYRLYEDATSDNGKSWRNARRYRRHSAPRRCSGLVSGPGARADEKIEVASETH
jgi:hypothetical protein